MTELRRGSTVAQMPRILPSPAISRRSAAVAGLLSVALAISLVLAIGAPRAHAASCTGPIQADGSFSFTCDTQLGQDPSPTHQLFILDSLGGTMTLTSATIASPPGIACFGSGDLYCKGPAVPVGTTVAGSVVAAEGPFCTKLAAPGIYAFLPGSPYAATYAVGLRCAPVSEGGKSPAADVPKWKKKCLKIKDKTKRKKCIKNHKKAAKRQRVDRLQ